MSSPKLYDPKCGDLAQDFLADYPDKPPTPAEVEELAWTIQSAIEDWLADHGREER